MHVTIHIGWHKTGSTAVQDLLLRNADQLARRHGVHYPGEGLLTVAHHNMAYAFAGQATSAWGPVPQMAGGPDAYIGAAVASAKAKGCTQVVISSEVFCTLEPPAVAALAASVRARATGVRIVAYLRRQDRFAESSYNMDVKWWGCRMTADFDEYLARHAPPADYARVLDTWAGAFGREALLVRRYDRDAFIGRDVRADFFAALGLSLEGLDTAPSVWAVNDSLGPRTLEMLRVLNQLDVPQAAHDQIVNRLRVYDAKHRSPAPVLFEPDARRAYLASHASGNRELASYGIDAAAFAHLDTPAPRNVHRLTPPQFTELFSFLAGRE